MLICYLSSKIFLLPVLHKVQSIEDIEALWLGQHQLVFYLLFYKFKSTEDIKPIAV
jgi:hypothetical protein